MIPENLQKLLDANKWEEALVVLKEYDKPLSDELMERLCWCYSRTERYAEAITICDELMKKQPNNAKLLYTKGYQFYAQKNWQTAADCFVQTLEIYPEYFKVKYRLAYSYIQIAGVEQTWTKGVFWKAISQLEDCHRIYGAYDTEKAERERATYADVCCLHGKTIAPMSKYIDRGISLLQKSLSLKDDLDCRYQLAKAFYTKKDYERALSELPNIDKPYYIPELRSQILAESGNVTEAYNILLYLIRFRKKDYLYQRLASYSMLLSNLGKAKEFALIAVQADKRNYKNYLLCGKVCREERQLKTAVSYFEQAREIKQKLYNTDCSEAIQLIDEIIEQSDGNPTDLIPIIAKSSSSIKSGSIANYNSEKGFGFIKEKETGSSYFFHVSQFEKGIIPKQSMSVCFETESTQRGEQAIKICVV